MDESDFRETITGEVRWTDSGSFCHFHPHDLPFDWECSRGSLAVMRGASVELARLDGMMRFIGDDAVAMMTANMSLVESVSSSSIEGTRSTLDDVLLSEKGEDHEGWRARDSREVENYRRALLQGFRELPVGGEITVDMIRGLHRTLMEGTRGSDRSPGEFKTTQNAIGRPGDTLGTARMVPASPASVDHLLDNWLAYVNSDAVDTLEKVAVAHYQFEAIHPFRDGNGRVGRLLMLMILRRDGLLVHPILHMSGYLDSRRGEYLDLMYRVSTEDALDDWVSFVAEGLRRQALSTAGTVTALLRYRDALRAAAADANASRLADLLFGTPYITVRDAADAIGVSLPTASKLISRLESEGVLREVTGRTRGRIWCAEGVMEILRGRVRRG